MNVQKECAEVTCSAEGILCAEGLSFFCSFVLVCLASYAYCLVVFILIWVWKRCCNSAEHVLKCLCVLIAIVSTTIYI